MTATLLDLHQKYCPCVDAAWDRYCDSMVPTYTPEEIDHMQMQDARLISDLTVENNTLSEALDWYVQEVQRLKDKYEPKPEPECDHFFTSCSKCCGIDIPF